MEKKSRGKKKKKTRKRTKQVNIVKSTQFWTVLIAVLVIIAAGIFWQAVKDDPLKSEIYGMSGVQGIVTSISPTTRSFDMERTTIGVVNGENVRNRSVFTVVWDDKTQFSNFETFEQLRDSLPTPVEAKSVELDKNVLVEGKIENGNVIMAKAVYIMPGTSKAEVLE